MHAGGEAVLGSQAGEELGERRAVRRVEGGEEVLAVAARYLSDVAQALLTGRGHVQRVVPAVARVATAFEETVALEFVDEHDEPAGEQPELTGQRLLGTAGFGGDRADQAGVGGGESERGDAFGEQRS